MTELSDQTGLDQPFAVFVDALYKVDNHYLIHQKPSESVCINWLLPASLFITFLPREKNSCGYSPSKYSEVDWFAISESVFCHNKELNL